MQRLITCGIIRYGLALPLILAAWKAVPVWAQTPQPQENLPIDARSAVTTEAARQPGRGRRGSSITLRRQFDPEYDINTSDGAEDPDADRRQRNRRIRHEEALGGLQANSLDTSRNAAQNVARGRTGTTQAGSQIDGAADRLNAAGSNRQDGVLDPSAPHRTPDADTPGNESYIDPLAGQDENQETGSAGHTTPYDPLGVRVGSFLLFPEISIEGSSSDNALLSSTNARSDRAVIITPNLAIRSNWSRHLLEGTLGGIRSYYSEFPELEDKQFSSSLHGRLDVKRRTKLDIRTGYDLNQEAVDSNDAPTGAAERTSYTVKSASLEATHRFNRVTSSLRGSLRDVNYDDVALRGGGFANNDDRDLVEREITGRLSYQFRPGVQGFVESSGNERNFAFAFDDNGIRNGSSGYEVQAGISLEFGGKLNGEIAVGFARQTPEERALDDIVGLILNGFMEWHPTQLTTVRFAVNTEVEETTLTDSAGSISRTSELSVEHAFRRNMIAGVSLGYSLDEFSGSGQKDRTYRAGLSGEYLLSREVALTANYDFRNRVRSIPNNDYIENEFRFGVRLRR